MKNAKKIILRPLEPAAMQPALMGYGAFGMEVHPNPEKLGLSSSRLQRIKTWMQKYIDDGKLPGATTLVARHGKVVFCETLGYGDLEKKKPLALDSILRFYYMSKPINPERLLTALAHLVASDGPHEVSGGEGRGIDNLPGEEAVPGLDLDRVVRRLGGNRGLLVRLLSHFTSHHSNDVNEIRDAWKAGEHEKASAMTHHPIGEARREASTDAGRRVSRVRSSVTESRSESSSNSESALIRSRGLSLRPARRLNSRRCWYRIVFTAEISTGCSSANSDWSARASSKPSCHWRSGRFTSRRFREWRCSRRPRSTW